MDILFFGTKCAKVLIGLVECAALQLIWDLVHFTFERFKMKVVVVGKGLAGHGIIEALNKKSYSSSIECLWLGPEMTSKKGKEWMPCSLNTTSLVALQGIEKNVSPLGDLLYESFFSTKNFLKKERPEGVQETDRFHLALDPKDEAKMKERHGSLENLTFKNKTFVGVSERAFLFEPTRFFSWWNQKISDESRMSLERREDLVLSLDLEKKIVTTEKGIISFDKLILATGALGLDLVLKEDSTKGKKVVGHYFKKRIDSSLFGEKSFVVTLNGHNLIYNHHEKTIILGGTNQGSGPLAMELSELKKQRDSFLSLFPEWECELRFKREFLFTGVRYKAPKRMPFWRTYNPNIGEINGFYKNGWSLCHHLPEKLINELFE